ncbi:MAG: alpha/beta fold hydrolase [Bacillota bacterium]
MKKSIILITTFIILNLFAFFILNEQAFRVSWLLAGTAFGIIAIALTVLVILLFVKFIFIFIPSSSHLLNRIIGKTLIVLTLFIGLLIAQIALSEVYVTTTDEGDNNFFETIEVNGTDQSLFVRTKNLENPVILFLAGGPGGSQIPATSRFLRDLEDTYTVVHWEQPGVGKSYNARPIDSLAKDIYLEDAIAVTKYLKDTYNQNKIYIIGESWGSFLAVELAKSNPEYYYAILTTGQMVDFVETELYCYDKALEIAQENNDQRQIDALEKLDVPITGGNITLEAGTYLQYLHMAMERHEDITHPDYSTFDLLFSPEYSIMDSLNYLRGVYFTFSHVYQQLYGIDLRKTSITLDVPIYIIQGKYDYNAPVYLAEDYYNQLTAPDKEFIIFNHSGHNPWINQSDLFNDTVKSLLTQHIEHQ